MKGKNIKSILIMFFVGNLKLRECRCKNNRPHFSIERWGFYFGNMLKNVRVDLMEKFINDHEPELIVRNRRILPKFTSISECVDGTFAFCSMGDPSYLTKDIC